MARKATAKRRADGFYQRSISIGRKPDGKPIRKVIYAKTIKQLDAMVEEYRAKLERGTLSANEKTTFGELGAVWLASYKASVGAGTRRMYQSIFNKHLAPAMGSVALKDLKPHNLQSLINDLAEADYAEKTIKEIRNTAVQIMEIALDNDILFRNVFKKVTVPQNTQEQGGRSFRSHSRRAYTNTLKGLLRPGDHVITTQMEHNAVARPLTQLQAQGIDVDVARCGRDGRLDLSDMESKITGRTKLVIMTHASNVCGVILPIRDVGAICRDRGALLVVDCAQTAGVLPISMQRDKPTFWLLPDTRDCWPRKAPMGSYYPSKSRMI